MAWRPSGKKPRSRTSASMSCPISTITRSASDPAGAPRKWTYGALRWTVDTAEDLELLRQVYAHFPGRDDFSWLEVLDLLERQPELLAINAGVQHKHYRQVDERARALWISPMSLLTLFSAPKPFTNPHIAVIQRNAHPILAAPGSGGARSCWSARKPGWRKRRLSTACACCRRCSATEGGTPLVSSIFALARQASDSPFLAYVNGDILLLPDIVDGHAPDRGAGQTGRSC